MLISFPNYAPDSRIERYPLKAAATHLPQALTKGLFLFLSSTGGDHHPHITVEGATDLDPDLDPIHLVAIKA